MHESLPVPRDYQEASIKAAQHLDGLTFQQDIWSETGKMLVSFFGADLCAFGEREADGEIIGHHWTFSYRFPDRGDLEAHTREAIAEVLESGLLSTRILSIPDPLAAAFFPITRENRVIAVMVAGHLMSEPVPEVLLSVYLAVAGLVGATAARLASERELRTHRLHLEQLVTERTAELTEANDHLRLDIAGRKRAEETLRASDELYASIFGHIGIGVAFISPDKEILFLNNVMKQWFPHIDVGRRPLCYRSFNEPPRGEVCPYCPTALTLRDGTVHSSTAVTPTAAGTRRFRIVSTPVLSDDGTVSYIIKVLDDVTEHRRAEESNSHLASIVESSDDAIISKTLDGVITSWNAGAEKVYGYSASEAVGKHVSFLVPPGQIDEIPLLVERIVAGQSVTHYETIRVRKGGRYIHVSLSLSPIRDLRGAVMGISTIARNVTERKRTEDELRRLNAYNRSLIEASLDPLVTIGPDGRITDVNAATEEVTGLRRGKLVGTDFCDYFTDPGAARAGYLRVFTDGSVRDYPLEILHRDGHATPVLYNATVYRDAAGTIIGVFAAARDITERMQAEADRLEMERRMLHGQKLESLGVLAGGIAHDFNNLLAVILGDLDLALMTLPHDSPVRARIDQALQASQRAASLIRQMLAYAGKGHFNLKEIDLNEIVSGNAVLFRTSVARNIALEIIAAPGLPLIKADQGQVQQVIMNLIINASEAIGAGSGAITLRSGLQECDDECLKRSRVDVKPGGGMFVFLEVSDTGCGMDEETRLRLFEPFFTTKFTGRGLGMAAVLGIVRAHKGAILLESEPGQGTTFRVLFPVSTEVIGATRERQETARPAKMQAAPGGTILVVDDEDMVRDLCLVCIRTLGFQAVGAADGYEAIKIFRERADEITFVVLDMTMPNMDGAHAFYELRKIRPDVRVIISSGYSEEDVSGQFDGEMPTGFIHKPFRIEVLRSKIAQVMNRKD
jgi:PAS domain S-box-containing protein